MYAYAHACTSYVHTYIMYGVSVLPSNPCPGLILVHDLTNRKTHSHLTKWLTEFHNSSKGQRSAGKTSTRSSISHSEPFRYCTVCLFHLVMPHPLTSPCDVTLCDLSTHVTRPVHTCHTPCPHMSHALSTHVTRPVHTCHTPCPHMSHALSTHVTCRHAMSTHVTCPVRMPCPHMSHALSTCHVHTCHMPCPHMSHALSTHVTCHVHTCHMPCPHISHALSTFVICHVTCPVHICHMPCHMPCPHMSHAHALVSIVAMWNMILNSLWIKKFLCC